jgi:hypothetical protein
MTEKEKGTNPFECAPSGKSKADSSTDNQHNLPADIDPVMGWHALAKPARLAQDRKRGKRGAR